MFTLSSSQFSMRCHRLSTSLSVDMPLSQYLCVCTRVHAAQAAYCSCSIGNISRMMCGVRSSLHMMIRLGMMFCPAVQEIHHDGSQIYSELLFAFTVSYPVESHVIGVSLFELHHIIYDCVCHCQHWWCGRLCVSQFLKYDSDEYGFVSHYVYTRQFCFSG